MLEVTIITDYFCEQNFVQIGYWLLLDKAQRAERMQQMSSRYPTMNYLPIARRDDCDDVLCVLESEGKQSYVIVHDFASAGYELTNEKYPDFEHWLVEAIMEANAG